MPNLVAGNVASMLSAIKSGVAHTSCAWYLLGVSHQHDPLFLARTITGHSIQDSAFSMDVKKDMSNRGMPASLETQTPYHLRKSGGILAETGVRVRWDINPSLPLALFHKRNL